MSGKITDVFRQRKSGSERSRSGGKGASKDLPELPGVSGVDAVTDSDISQEERVLRQFDLDTRYGPCVGMSRMERWLRAEKFGLNPSPQIKELLEQLDGQQIGTNSLWHGRL